MTSISIKNYKILVALYCISCLWGLSAPFIGYSLFDLEDLEHILKWDTYGAVYAPNVLLLYLKEVLYFIGGVLVFYTINVGRVILLVMLVVELVLATLMGVSVSSSVDLFVGIINGVLLGGILSLAYFSELKPLFKK